MTEKPGWQLFLLGEGEDVSKVNEEAVPHMWEEDSWGTVEGLAGGSTWSGVLVTEEPERAGLRPSVRVCDTLIGNLNTRVLLLAYALVVVPGVTAEKPCLSVDFRMRSFSSFSASERVKQSTNSFRPSKADWQNSISLRGTLSKTPLLQIGI